MTKLPLAVIRRCQGEAHSNPWIDHCPVCMPNWGFTLHCASCGTHLQYGTGRRSCTLNRRCPVCGITHARVDYKKLYHEQGVTP